MSPLQGRIGHCCLVREIIAVFIVRTVRNTKIHSIGQNAGRLYIKVYCHIVLTGP
jgi:hypothetical protein